MTTVAGETVDQVHRGECPSDESLAAYLDRRLPEIERDAIERHLGSCERCRDISSEAVECLDSSSEHVPVPVSVPQPPPRHEPRVLPMRSRWRGATGTILALAASLALTAWLAPAWWYGTGPAASPDEAAFRAALALEPTRPFAGRLSGYDDYALPPAATRGPAGTTQRPDLRIAIANLERTPSSADARRRHLLGVALSVGGRLDEGLMSLRAACEGIGTDAACWNDLSAAYLQQDTSSDVSAALGAAERALALSPDMREALFNRALALERLARVSEAIEAWRRVEQLETSSGWGREAARHAATLAPSRP